MIDKDKLEAMFLRGLLTSLKTHLYALIDHLLWEFGEMDFKKSNLNYRYILP